MKNLPSDKATPGDIPVNVLQNSEICFFDLTNCINEDIIDNKFPDSIELSDITPVYKKIDPSDKANCSPVCFIIIIKNICKNHL